MKFRIRLTTFFVPTLFGILCFIFISLFPPVDVKGNTISSQVRVIKTNHAKKAVLQNPIRRSNVKQRGVKVRITPKVQAHSQNRNTIIQPMLTQPKMTAYLAMHQTGIIGQYEGRHQDNPTDNIFTINLSDQPTILDRVWLSYKLKGVDDNSNVACSINDRLAFGGYLVKQDSVTKRQRIQLSANWLQKGLNRIQFGLPENAEYGYKVSDLSIEIERGTEPCEFVVTGGQRSYAGKAYIHGFITNVKDINANVRIDGKSVALRDGEFEALVDVSATLDANIEAIINDKSYSRLLHFKGCKAADKQFALNQNVQKMTKTFVKGKVEKFETPFVQLSVEKNTLLKTEQLSLTTLRVMDMPALELGMTNVTDGRSGFRFLPHGEHFNNGGATVALKYDRTKIPDGYKENDIKTFYFDKETNHWVALERDSIDKSLCMVVSKTTHFTDMINGVLRVPESPETQGFTPTMMEGIKAADPTAKISLIAPPSANNNGVASLSYNLELPPSRNGMSPSLGIQYNSDGGSGWLGEGWDLNIPSITVDTKFGVPLYDSNFETESYRINGTQLARSYITPTNDDALDEEMFLADRGTVYTRNKPLKDASGSIVNPNSQYQFYPRVETNFPLVIRYGTELDKYTWQVCDKSGVKYNYGSNYIDGEGNSIPATLADNDGYKIGEWKLQSMVDIHGDSVAYVYTKTTEEGYSGANGVILTPKSIYLSKIKTYTYSPTESTKYIQNAEIDFISNSKKAKKTNNARYGFFVSSQKLLDAIVVKYANANNVLETVRTYTFNYKEGKFQANLLASVAQQDSANQAVGSHTFDYYDDITNNNAQSFVVASPLIVGYDNLNNYENDFTQLVKKLSNPINNYGGIYNPTKKGLISNSNSTSLGGSLYLGIGIGPNVKSRALSLGVNGAYQRTNSYGKSMLIDINGDGVVDNVYEKGNQLYYDKGICDGQKALTFVQVSKALIGAPKSFSKTGNDNLTMGILADFSYKRAGISGRYDWDLINKSTTTAYFSDVNSDGLVDIVYNQNVYFNYLEAGEPHFSTNSNMSAIPMNKTTIYNLKPSTAGLIRYNKRGEVASEPTYDLTDIDVPDTEDELVTYDTSSEDSIMADASPMQDIVRVWTAPYTGQVKISGAIQLLVPTGVYDSIAYQYADGVRVAIQYENTELWWKKIAKTETTATSTNVSVAITKGERLFFRVQCGDSLLSNGDFDKVLWSPQVEYTSTVVEEHTDELGYSNYVYKAKDGDVVDNHDCTEIESAGPVTIGFEITKPMTRSDIQLQVFSSNYPSEIAADTTGNEQVLCNQNYEYTRCYENNLGKESATNFSISTSIANNTHKYFWVKLISSSDEKWEDIKCYPHIYFSYLNSETGETVNDTIAMGVNYEINFDTTHVENPICVDNELTRQLIKADEFVSNITGFNSSYPSTVSLVLPKNMSSKKCSNFYRVMGVVSNNASFERCFHEGLTDTGGSGYFANGYTANQGCTTGDLHDLNIKAYVFDEGNTSYCSDNPIYFDVTQTIAYTTPIYVLNQKVKPDVYVLKEKELQFYGPMRRNWGQFQYNTAEGRYARPLEVDSLIPQNLNDSNNIDFETKRLVQLIPNTKTKRYWTGSTDNVSVFGDTICAGRQYANNVKSHDEIDTQDSNGQSSSGPAQVKRKTQGATTDNSVYYIKAPNLVSKQKNKSLTGQISFDILPKKLAGKLKKKFNLGVSLTSSNGTFEKLLDYIDMNGDGYPDYFNNGKIYYSNSRGTTYFTSTTCKTCKINPSDAENMTTSATAFGVSAGPPKISTSTVDATVKAIEESANISASGSVNNSINNLQVSYIDINGDGLPDMIHHGNAKENGNVSVSFNLGYSFTAPIEMELYNTNTTTFSANGGLGVGYEKGNGSWSLGVGTGASVSSTTNRVMDMNADGLPDIVSIGTSTLTQNVYSLLDWASPQEVKVRLNNGKGFDTPIVWGANLTSSKNAASSLSANAAFTYGFPLFWVLKFVFTPAVQASTTNDRTLDDIRDINGDGYPDFVSTDLSKTSISVKFSGINRSNKLRSVTNPLEGKFIIDYMHSVPTTNHPSGKWVMKSLEQYDGISDDGDNTYNEFEYELGKYNRRERQFDGFGKVTTKYMEPETK